MPVIRCVQCGVTYDPREQQCECVRCAHCNTVRAPWDRGFCGYHTACTSCCGCTQCADCGRNVLRGERCRPCAAGGRDTHGLQFRTLPLQFFDGKRSRRAPVRRFVGIEMEVSRTSNFTPVYVALNRWKTSVVSDGSVPGGYELRLQPARSAALVEMVTDVCEALARGGAQVNRSCGLHVHIDAGPRSSDYGHGLGPYDVKRVIQLWGTIEVALLDMVDPARWRDGQYCRPMHPTIRAAVESSRTKRAVRTAATRTIFGSNRYQALNVLSLAAHDTFEVRLHPGSVRADEIIPWAQLCAAVVDFANRKSEAEVSALADLAPHDALLAIAPTPEVVEYIKARWRQFGTRVSLGGAPPADAAGGEQILYCASCAVFHGPERDFGTAMEARGAGFDPRDMDGAQWAD